MGTNPRKKIAQPTGLTELQSLAAPSLLSKLESLFVPDPPTKPKKITGDSQKVIESERNYLRKRYNVTPHLSGSMPLGLHLPGDVDIDFFARIESPRKYKNVVRRLEATGRYQSSPFNVAGANYQVYQRPAEGPNDYPVDFAIAFGKPGLDYRKSIQARHERASQLPDDLRKALVERKRVLKNTPFDIKQKRYKSWKRELDAALGGGVRLKRQKVPELEKSAKIVDLKNPKEEDKFKRFVQYKDMYGHRTHNIDAVLETGGLISALEALRRGKLKSYEAGASVGTHAPVQYKDLTPQQLNRIETAVLSKEPNTDVFEDVADETNRSEEAVKADFIRQRYNRVRKFVNTLEDPEDFRKEHLAIPKLGPNIFVTKGGVLDEPAYGDNIILLRSRTAKTSPFMNLLTDEHIVPHLRPFEPRKLNIGSGYAIVPQQKIRQLNKEHPNVKFVAREQVPQSVQESILKPTRSLKEVVTRWVPQALSGDLSVRQTR